MGISGISIRKNVSKVAGGSSVIVFDGCSNGVVLFKIDDTGMAGKYDAIVYIVNENNIRTVKFNEGTDAYYQKFKITDGILTIENTGYGTPNFTAYHIQ